MADARVGDEELMAMIGEGRAEALESLYDRYAGPSYSLALRILGDRGAAEEVVQDTFVAAWRRSETYNPESGRVYSWLLGITRNRAIDELRRRSGPTRGGGVQSLLPGEASGLLRDPDASVSEAAWVSEVRSFIGGALEKLPKDQREVLEMAYLGGLTQREIAERTGTPLGTVKTRTRLALKKLRKILEPVMRESVDLDGL